MCNSNPALLKFFGKDYCRNRNIFLQFNMYEDTTEYSDKYIIILKLALY